MGVNMGILPTKGLTLPLMSYGGGSMMIMCCAVALLFRVQTEVAGINSQAQAASRSEPLRSNHHAWQSKVGQHG
jgi:cell division protein FtsW